MKEHVGICTSGQWGIEVPHVTTKKIVSKNDIVTRLENGFSPFENKLRK
jgi:hypothetical protein